MKDLSIIALIQQRYPGYAWEMLSDRGERSSYRLKCADAPPLYVKILHPSSGKAALRNRLHPRTLKEFHMLASLERAGIKVARVMDHVRLEGASALITQYLNFVSPLFTLPGGEQAAILLRLACQLWEQGFVPYTLLAEHVVLLPNNVPVLVAAPRITRKSLRPRRDLIKSFAMLCAAYAISYEVLHAGLPEKYREDAALLTSIQEEAKAAKHAQVARAVRKSLHPGMFSEEVRTPEYTAVLRRGYMVDLDAIIAGHHKNIREDQNLLKYQAKTQVSIVQDWCVKSYKKPRILSSAYALRSWKGLLSLYFHGLPVAHPVACVIFRDGSSMLVTRAIAFPPLDKTLFHDYHTFPASIRHAIPERLGEMIGSMHARGIYHADLKACNILVDKTAVQFVITDTDRVALYRHIPENKRIKNLLQIHLSIPRHVSRAFRMRFLKGYTKETREDAKVLFSKVWGLSYGMEIVYTTERGDKFERWDEQRQERRDTGSPQP